MKWFLHCKLIFLWRMKWTKNYPGRDGKSKPTTLQKEKKCCGNHFSRGNTTRGTALKSQWLTKMKIYFPTYDGCRGFPHGSVVKNPPANAGDIGDAGSIPGLGRSPGVGNGNPLQSSCLGNSTDRGALWATVHGVSKESDTVDHACTLPVSCKLSVPLTSIASCIFFILRSRLKKQPIFVTCHS